jgi:predicted site-specific integrase-resolvase
MNSQFSAPELLTPAEIAALYRVDVKTVGRWDAAGKFPEGTVIRTPGGTRRYRAAVIYAMLSAADGSGSAS